MADSYTEQAKERRRQIARHFSAYTNYWDNVYNENDTASGRSLIQQVNMNYRSITAIKFIDKFAGNRALEVLDAGCGTGHLMESIIKMGHTVKGVDISEKMVEASNSKISLPEGVPACLMAPVERLPFEEETFDAVTCLGVVEYLLEPETGIKEMARVLKSGGLLVVSAPNLIKLQYLLDPYYYFKRGVRYFLLKMHILKKKRENIHGEISGNKNFANTRFTFKKITSLFRRCGFELTGFENIGFGPLTFWNRIFLNDVKLLGINSGLISLSHKKAFRFLKYFSNRWVFCLRKVI